MSDLSPEKFFQLGFGFWASKVFLSAIELGVFSGLAKGPLEGPALASRLGLHARGWRDFFDTLVATGALLRDGGRYSNTPEANAFLDRAKPSYVGGIFEMANAITKIVPEDPAPLASKRRNGRRRI